MGDGRPGRPPKSPETYLPPITRGQNGEVYVVTKRTRERVRRWIYRQNLIGGTHSQFSRPKAAIDILWRGIPLVTRR